MIKSIALVLLLAFGLALAPVEPKGHQFENWKRYTPDGCGLSLELPSAAVPLKLPIPDDLKKDVRYLRYYQSAGDQFVLLIIHCSSFKSLSAKGFAKGVTEGLFDHPDVTDFKVSTEPGSDLVAPLKGTYKQKGTALEMNGFAMGRETHTWSVIGMFRQGNEAAAKSVQRALESANFDGSQCPDQ